MAKIRVHQLAKELGIDSKLIMEEAERHGISVKNHMSSLEGSDEFMLRAFLEPLRAQAAPPAPSEVVAEPPAPPRAPAAPPPPAGAPRPAPPPPVREVQVQRPGATPSPRPAELPAPIAPAALSTQPEPPRTVSVRPPGAPPAAAPESRPAPPPPPPPAREVQVQRQIPSAVVTPPVPSAGAPPREPAPPRRQAEVLGRRDIAGTLVKRTAGPGAGTPASGLIPTRSEGGKRTFVVTGRGRGRSGATPAGPAQRGRNSTRGISAGGTAEAPKTAAPSTLEVELPITVKGLSEAMGIKANLLIQRLFVNHKRMVKINDPLDKETVELLGLEFECEITCREKQDVETRVLDDLQKSFVEEPEDRAPRAPIVAFLGHVDHGKTSLLDAIRETNVASREHGGITQHIGASRIELPTGQAVVLLDTPGHRAFTEMRARGAQITDIVVLVVAADDGVMPQTKEAIAHARAANVPIVVALNKIDKPDANPPRVRQELMGEGLQDEKWGGKTIIVETSAVTRKGIPELLEAILLEAEVLELRANPRRPAVGTVLEAEQSRGEGNLARLLVQEGTLQKGDFFVCGTAYGRIRAIKSTGGQFLTEAGPSMPVEIAGLNELPAAGDRFYVLPSLEEAKEIATRRLHLQREKDIAKKTHVSLEKLFEQIRGQTLKIILKTDVTGSLEVLKSEIEKLVHPEIRPEIIHAAVGGITETDVTLADASDAVILGFHVSADMGARRLAEQKGVEIRIYQVIYKLIEEVKAAMEGRLAPEEKEVITGEAVVRKTWKVSRIGTIAGCFVQTGLIKKTSRIRVSRGGIVILDEGSLASLKRVKDDVREVKEGFECGLVVANFENIEPDDVITAFETEKLKRTFDATA
jgi:translation initiation factor IF-2